MGRCVESPVVKLKGQGPPAPRLLWEPVKKGTEDGGEILVAFELFLVSFAKNKAVSVLHIPYRYHLTKFKHFVTVVNFDKICQLSDCIFGNWPTSPSGDERELFKNKKYLAK